MFCTASGVPSRPYSSSTLIGSNLLAARLKDLKAADIVERRAGNGHSRDYALTERGQALEPAILALIRWGLTHGPGSVEGDHHRDDWDLLALKALFQPERVEDLSVTVQFCDPGFNGWARVEDQQMNIGTGTAADATIKVDGSVADLFLRADDPQTLLLDGDACTLHCFMSAFALRA